MILVGGAFQHRAIDAGTRELTTELTNRGFTAVHYDRPGRGASITGPVLVVLGEQTPPIMESASASIRAALPQAREVRVPGANHRWELPGLLEELVPFLT